MTFPGDRKFGNLRYGIVIRSLVAHSAMDD